MKKRIRASAIIFVDDKLITVYREKIVDGILKKYYVIPGGGVEENETIEEATKREVLEEIGIEIELSDNYFYLNKEESEEYFYIAKYKSGTIGTGTGPEFTDRDVEKYGTYEIKLVPKDEIENINLLPEEVKVYILQKMQKSYY